MEHINFPTERWFELRPRQPSDCTIGSVLIPPVALCTMMMIIAAVAVSAASIDAWPLLSYFECATVTLLCALSFNFIDVAKLAVLRADNPLLEVKVRMKERAPLLLLPALMLPVFLIGYTASKCAIAFLVGYTWDAFWANADRAIFGDDAWRLALSALGTSNIQLWTWCYAVAWGSVFLISANAIAWYASKRFVGVFFTAMLGTWLIGGCLMAYAVSAAGPVFAPMFDPSLADRFKPLQDFLEGALGNGPIGFSQHYLARAVHEHVAAKGAGVSAMPSMHLATVSVYILAARRTKWLIPAVVFWLLIFVLSAYFGFHYWVDGIAAVIVAAGCWFAAERYYDRVCRIGISTPQARAFA